MDILFNCPTIRPAGLVRAIRPRLIRFIIFHLRPSLLGVTNVSLNGKTICIPRPPPPPNTSHHIYHCMSVFLLFFALAFCLCVSFLSNCLSGRSTCPHSRFLARLESFLFFPVNSRGNFLRCHEAKSLRNEEIETIGCQK